MSYLSTRALIIAFALTGLLAMPMNSPAQSPADLTLAQAGSMPGWTVPVLRLVSATHVEPTTGIVLTDSGMVLVPAEFAGPGDEIIVLDGGTDIIRHGKPAKILRRFSAEGLQVLSVPTLGRRGPSFTAVALEDGQSVRLSAFPPAELIAEGKAPLDITVSISVPSENGKPRISGENPLPNVSGALVDECGNLAGYSAASGVQSMATDEFPRYQWKATLIEILQELQLEVRIDDCQPLREAQPAEEATLTEPEPVEPEEASQPEVEESKDDEPKDDEPKDDEPVVEEPEAAVTQGESEQEEQNTADSEASADMEEDAAALDILPPIEDEPAAEVNENANSNNENDTLPQWLWLLAAVVLLSGGFLVHRFRKNQNAEHTEESTTQTQPLPVTEESIEPPPATPGLDSELLVHGELTDGTRFEHRCAVSSKAINLIIGRSNADISIDSPAVSRRHATLNGTAGMLTLSDLGSSNGTSINGVPCLEGETMFVSPGDALVVGNARLHLAIIPAAADKTTR